MRTRCSGARGSLRRGARAGARRLWRDERGDTTFLEAALVFPSMFFLIFATLAMFTLMYQRWNFQVIASEAATRMGQIYKYASIADPLTGKITNPATNKVDVDKILAISPYRNYDMWDSSWGTFTHMGNVSSAIDNYVLASDNSRLNQTTFARVVEEVTVNTEFQGDGLMRQHLIVTIHGSYYMPFADALHALGLDWAPVIEVSAQADCIDLSDYLVTTLYMSSMSDNIARLKSIEGLGDDTDELHKIGTRALDLMTRMKTVYSSQQQ